MLRKFLTLIILNVCVNCLFVFLVVSLHSVSPYQGSHGAPFAALDTNAPSPPLKMPKMFGSSAPHLVPIWH